MSATLLGLARILLVLGLVAVHAFGAYAILLLLGASFRKARRRPATAGATLPRIAAVVVAHDEERVVLHSVKSLLRQSYPADRYEVIVVADHCVDGTARVAREAGAEVVERMTGVAEGKPAAVAFGVRAVAERGGFDAVAIFDADNHVHPDFLARIAERLGEGEQIVQGLVDSKNPSASWVSGSSALGFWAIATVAQAPRERLGLSVPLMGTGFAMTLAEAGALLEGSDTLADDLELGARVVLSGLRVVFADEAVTADEKPQAIGVAAAQRQRWMQGRWAVAEAYVPRLVRAAVRAGTQPAARRRQLDVAVQLLSPSLLFLGVAAVAGGLLLVLTELASGRAEPSRLAVASVAAGALYYLLPAPSIARFRPPARVWTCYALQPLYLALSAPLAVSGFLTRRRRKWWRTPKG